MVKLNMVGDLFSSGGYSSHFRSLVNALYKQNKEIHLDVGRPAGWELKVNDAELAMLKTPRFKDGKTVMIALPQMWPLGLLDNQKEFWGFCVWEGDRIPANFIPIMKKCDGIFVPSVHVRDAIWKSLQEPLEIPVHIVPHGVDTALFIPQPKPDIFTFVANKGWAQGINDRGGLQFALQAFCEEFAGDERVQFVVKINTVYSRQGWNIHQELANLKLNPKGLSKVKIVLDTVEFSQLPRIYAGHCFVSPSMAEAFSLCCAEALSCGLPVITSNYSGMLDYVNNENGWLIDCDPVENTWDVAYEGINWVKPRLAHLGALMRYAYENPDLCLQKGKKGLETASRLTWEHSAKTLLAVLSDRG